MRTRIRETVAPLIVFGFAIGLYFSTLAPGMLRGDSGEFQWSMASLNVPHATGYPLFTLLGNAWLKIPLLGTVAWRLNLLSALFGAAAASMVFILARSMTKMVPPAFCAAVFFALAPVIWFNASILEVYTLNAFFLSSILYFLWRWSNADSRLTDSEARQKAGNDWPLYVAFLLIGLALAHHRLTLLILPGIFVFVLMVERAFPRNWRRLIVLALMLIPGLALYAFVPLRLVSAGESLHYALFDIILGQEYSASLLRGIYPIQSLIQIAVQNFHIGLVLAIVGFAFLFRRSRSFFALLLLIFLADLVFALLYSVPDVEVFLTPSFVILALWIGVGSSWVLDFLRSRLPPTYSRVATLGATMILIALPLFGLTNYSEVQAQVQAEAGTEEQRARQLAASNLPQGAMLELDWETATALRFLQVTEGLRPDLEARLLKLNALDEYIRVLQNADAGRPVYVEPGVKWTRALAGYREDTGILDLLEIRRQAVDKQPLGTQIDESVQLAAIHSDNTSFIVYWLVQRSLDRDLSTYIHFFDAQGQPLGQEDHGACCEAVYGYRSSEWLAGRLTADSFRRLPTGTAYIHVGMYSLKGDELEPYGRTVYMQTLPILPQAGARQLGLELGQGIVLRAYELFKSEGHAKVTLYWESRVAVDKDYVVFAHAIDSTRRILEQADHQPLAGVYPTSAWLPRQIIADTCDLPLTNAANRLEFGMYDPANGQRLIRADGNGDSITIELP